MKILKTDELKTLPFFKSLGPEPIPSPGSGTPLLTLPIFEAIVKKSNLPIKVLLMDQQKIGGIGNIYANDACFAAHIDPRRKAKTLTDDEIKTLFDSILKVLEKAMKYRGSSELNFVDVLGQLGEYQKHFLVYGRKGKPCTRADGGTVEKIYLAGRGTFYCTVCQH
ncbi:MAG TPA: DNA-formamidopyrimidine glycosylase, partial [Patescibacteria group bacterium]|nr:DNA-formamidopyrimidine glycosylase [Patescibacteria group bacterium]